MTSPEIAYLGWYSTDEAFDQTIMGEHHHPSKVDIVDREDHHGEPQQEEGN